MKNFTLTTLIFIYLIFLGLYNILNLNNIGQIDDIQNNIKQKKNTIDLSIYKLENASYYSQNNRHKKKNVVFDITPKNEIQHIVRNTNEQPTGSLKTFNNQLGNSVTGNIAETEVIFGSFSGY